ncbi:MAG: prolyl oligopeptidase family serine peptidase [Caulobacter sp.]|nr:prolyl oligopeptidase family serine peptidase [Caulobacter sp.]
MRMSAPTVPRPSAVEDAARVPPRPQAPADPVAAIALSPDGLRHAWIESDAAGSSLWLAEWVGAARRLLRRTDATDLAWSSDGEWLFLVAPGKLMSLTTSNRTGSGIITQLGGVTGRRYLGVDAWRAAALVAVEDDSDGDGQVDRFALLRLYPGGRTEELWAGDRRVSSAITARDGAVWLRLVGQNQVEISRLDPSGKLERRYQCRPLERCSLVSVDQRGTLYLLTSAGANLDGLYRMNGTGPLRLVARDPLATGDGEGVVIDPVTRTPELLHIPYAGGRAVEATPAARRLLAALARRHPDTSEIRVAGHAQGRWLVGTRDGRHAAFEWELADDDGANWRPAFPHRRKAMLSPALPRRRLESFAASDGMRIFAYVTRPAGAARTPRPLVVLVHGGPWSISPPGYSSTAARLAAQGYLVVEPQFRASRGYGQRYMLAAGDDLGDGRVLRDLRESADWLVARGEADGDRMAIMGASFGGYAALMATTLWPDRFRGAVAMVPPADMAWVARYQAMAEQGDDAGLSLRTSFAHLGLDIANAPAMRRLGAQSPMAMANRLHRPVLLLAGDRDAKVPVRSVNAYAAKLCTLGKPFSYYVAPGQGHGLDGGPVTQSVAGLTDRFLAQMLGDDVTVRASGPRVWPGLVKKGCSLVDRSGLKQSRPGRIPGPGRP